MLKNVIRGGLLAAFGMMGISGTAHAAGLFPGIEQSDPKVDYVVQPLELEFFESTESAFGTLSTVFGIQRFNSNFIAPGPLAGTYYTETFSQTDDAFSVFGGLTQEGGPGDLAQLLLSGDIIGFERDGSSRVQLLATITGGLLAPEFSGGLAILKYSQMPADKANPDRMYTDRTGQVDIVGAGRVSEVPVPAALPLLLTGIAGLGFVSRRRKAA